MRQHPTLAGAILAGVGIAAIATIIHNMPTWPTWMLFPSVLLSVPALVAMMLGLGIVTVRALEPALALMDLDWDAEPLGVLGFPLPLQRKCEQLGFWSAEDLVKAVEKGKFPWVALEYDERMQIERAAQRWSASVAAEQREGKSRGTRPWSGIRGRHKSR
jgi:hypothetical protein